MKFAVLDLKASPPCIVLLTDDAGEAETTAERYANQNGYAVELADVSASEIIEPTRLTSIGAPRLLTAADFATAADARRAGFDVPLIISGTSDDVPKATSDDVAKKQPTKK